MALKPVEKSISLLLADDDPHMLFFLKHAMNREGVSHSITCVENGEELIARLLEHEKTKKQNFDCILIDLNMPRMNGREVLAEIREKKLAKNVPIMVISNSSYQPDIDAVMKLNATIFLEKPFGIEGYKAFVHKIVSVATQENIE